ncbi:hypothetical protein D3C87_283920 [compost metagenome]
MNNEQKVYELDEIWKDDWFSEEDSMRIRKLSEIVLSKNINSIVDIGCGNGLFLNFLHDNHVNNFTRLCGVERSESAIKHVKTEKYIAGIDNIPLSAREFDFVSCQEVIEHLPNAIYEDSIRELGRISNKYIMISVPFNENLLKSLVHCPSCKTKFNPEYHMRSFTSKELYLLEDLLGAKMIDTGYISVKSFMFIELIAKMVNGKSVFPKYTICPMCSYNNNDQLNKSGTKVGENPIKAKIKSMWPKTDRKRWIYGIFEKQIG